VWGNVETNYQRRTDLYSSVIKVVESSANFEKSLLKDVSGSQELKQLRLRLMSNDQKSLDQFQQAQGQLQGSFSKLLATVENYPDIKTTKAFPGFSNTDRGNRKPDQCRPGQDYNASVRKLIILKLKRFPE